MILGTYKYTHIAIIINNKIYNDRLIEYNYMKIITIKKQRQINVSNTPPIVTCLHASSSKSTEDMAACPLQ